MPVYLHALALKHYRGIGPEIQKLRSFQEFNFFIGANNSGESTILDYLRRHLNHAKNPTQYAELEIYRGQKSGNPVIAIGIPESVFLRNFYDAIGAKAQDALITEYIPKIC